MQEPAADMGFDSSIASEWVKDSRIFDLRLLNELSADVASILQSHWGPLLLWCLKGIRSEVASQLSQYVGCLDLRGLCDIEEAVALGIGTTRGYLNLSGLTALDAAAAAGLANQDGYLDLRGLEVLTEEAACELGRHQGVLDLSGLQHLSFRAAQHLTGAGAGKRIALNLNGLAAIEPATATCLAQAGQYLLLEGLRSIDLETMQAFAQGWMSGSNTLSENDRQIQFPRSLSVASISDAAKQILLSHEGSWFLGEYQGPPLAQTTPLDCSRRVTVAEALTAAESGDDSCFGFIRRMNRCEAISLSHHRGSKVGLYGLEELSVEVAEILAGRHELDLDIDFPPTTSSQAACCLLPYLNRSPFIPMEWQLILAEAVLPSFYPAS